VSRPIGQHKVASSKLRAALQPWCRVLVPVLLIGMGLTACGAPDGLQAANRHESRALVALADDRRLNLQCSGRGAPTVLLESGFGADSTAWSKVQPQLARVTRVCAYDRAGYGDSDPGPLPRDGAAITRDLNEALHVAGIKGPFIVVGHSSGGLYARLFAARRPADVQGIILLDPTVERRAPRSDGDGLNSIRRNLQRCLAVASSLPQPAVDDPLWSGCVTQTLSAHQSRLARRPDTWRNRLSELNNIFDRTSEQVARIGRVLRVDPIYVITASDTAAGSPRVPFGPPISIWEFEHQKIASASRQGFQTTVVSSHLVMIARPEVVIAAAREMIAASRENRLPGPLPASEVTRPDEAHSGDAFSLRNFGLRQNIRPYSDDLDSPETPFRLE
jgi:pimeloyl-ACP methyl ester carboxylesterase